MCIYCTDADDKTLALQCVDCGVPVCQSVPAGERHGNVRHLAFDHDGHARCDRCINAIDPTESLGLQLPEVNTTPVDDAPVRSGTANEFDDPFVLQPPEVHQ